MLDLDTRTAILRLSTEGHGARAIARILKLSRGAVRKVLCSGVAEVPALERDELLDPHLERIRELHGHCKGNLVRVHEELAAEDVEVGYSSLTSFCRRHEIGQPSKQRVGRYHFKPGEEMQHDTSPHVVKIDNAQVLVQCASLVLCYSRVLYAQVHPRWSRFECRAFLTEAIPYMGGAASRCMIDNSSVIIAHGRGPTAVPAAQMLALAERFGFDFEAHAVGDANRSARVERPFHHIENNFYAGRTFTSIDDLNMQLRQWCDRINNKSKRALPMTPFELLAAERPALKALPAFIPEVYELHTRRVDTEGYVSLHRNRYSMPTATIGRTVDIRESMMRVRVFDGHRLVVTHERSTPGAKARKTLPEHERDGRHGLRVGPSQEEKLLREVSPVLGKLIDRLRKRYGGQALRKVRRLHRMYFEYPTDLLVSAVDEALRFDLYDLERIDRMVLQRIPGEFFRLAPMGPTPQTPTDDNDDDDDTTKEPDDG
jgi:transposase